LAQSSLLFLAQSSLLFLGAKLFVVPWRSWRPPWRLGEKCVLGDTSTSSQADQISRGFEAQRGSQRLLGGSTRRQSIVLFG
jgi:hypothetical protein